MVTADFVLQGAFYALEQCGLLLRDAGRLYNAGSYASAIVLAAFGQEELGREKILLSIRAKILQGERITVDDIKKRCRVHVEKQRAGMLSTQMISNDGEPGPARLIRAQMTLHPQSQQGKDARAELAMLDRTLRKEMPGQRHDKREAALYVDPRSAHQWNRPADTSQLVAYNFIQDAVNDYRGEHDRRIVTRDPGSPEKAEIFDMLATWSGRPDLPQPEVLSLPWP